MHVSSWVSRIFCWQSWHINPFSRIILQVWQKSSKISLVWFGFPFRRRFIIWFMSVCTSGMFSIVMMFPLFFVVYLLIADWDKPRISAACLSFMPCFSMMLLAIAAFMAGKTVFTPTSHGSSIGSPVPSISVGNVYKYDECHVFYDVCHDGAALKTFFCTNLSFLLPSGHSSTRRMLNGGRRVHFQRHREKT